MWTDSLEYSECYNVQISASFATDTNTFSSSSSLDVRICFTAICTAEAITTSSWPSVEVVTLYMNNLSFTYDHVQQCTDSSNNDVICKERKPATGIVGNDSDCCARKLDGSCETGYTYAWRKIDNDCEDIDYDLIGTCCIADSVIQNERLNVGPTRDHFTLEFSANSDVCRQAYYPELYFKSKPGGVDALINSNFELSNTPAHPYQMTIGQLDFMYYEPGETSYFLPQICQNQTFGYTIAATTSANIGSDFVLPEISFDLIFKPYCTVQAISGPPDVSGTNYAFSANINIEPDE